MGMEKLKSILDMMPKIFYDENMLKTALGRVFTEERLARNVLFIVIESGVIDNALLVGSVNQDLYGSYIDTIHKDYGVEKAIAKKYIGWWLEALNVPYEDFVPEKVISQNNTAHECYDETNLRYEVQKAIETLTTSEKDAMAALFHEFEGMEGEIVASKIADKYGVTRSIIVNALKKLEAAGLVESNSMGMKGTHIQIINENFVTVLQEYKEKKAYLNKWRGR